MGATDVPSRTEVLVIGGGPSGSYAATAMAQNGPAVVLLEADFFPRDHVGESMLPSLRPFLRYIGAEEKVAKHGFVVKPGAAMKFNQWQKEGYSDFCTSEHAGGSTWNVLRRDFDEIILRHAASQGVQVFEGRRVHSIGFSPEDATRPISATFSDSTGDRKIIEFDYLVDASGRTGVMSQKYLRNRRMNSSLQNRAIWGYWKGAGSYAPGTMRENAPFFEALTNETGWAWFIPLHDGTVSVGTVFTVGSQVSKTGTEHQSSDVREQESVQDICYRQQLELAPNIKKLLGEAVLTHESGKSNKTSAAVDWSYSASAYSGPHFRLVGDAAAFIDPFFSSGVHLAFLGGLSAAATICASVKGDCSEAQAAKFHDQTVGTCYTRFLVVVMAAYKQMRSQNASVLSDVDEDNFDRAFDLIRPVIQGTADIGHRLTNDELHQAMDFVVGTFGPADPEMIETVAGRHNMGLLGKKVLATPESVDKLTQDEDERHVLKALNARKVLAPAYSGPRYLSASNVDGYSVRLQSGNLGLVNSTSPSRS